MQFSINDDPPKPRGCTNAKLRQVARLMTQHYEQYMLESGVRITQYSLLSTIHYLGRATPSDLARAMHMDNSTLTRNLRLMIEAGWVKQGPGADSRSRQVELTGKGLAVRQLASKEWRQAQDALNKKLGLAQVALLHQLLDNSLEKLQS
jgi:DNA-binding MarR family transcriptional regulator